MIMIHVWKKILDNYYVIRLFNLNPIKYKSNYNIIEELPVVCMFIIFFRIRTIDDCDILCMN